VLVTRVIIDAEDPALGQPTKPVGPYYSEEEARALDRDEGWKMVEQRKGWRRVVPSPRPLEIVELGAIRVLLQEGYIVIAAGGGGIPVVRQPDGTLRGVEAVVDKDLTSSLLAQAFDADLFLISTSVERVALDFGMPTQRWVDHLTAAEARRHLEEGQFPPGSMGPKIEAAVAYLESGGKQVVITSPESLVRALRGETGTRIAVDGRRPTA
jgi:carbamate kinase